MNTMPAIKNANARYNRLAEIDNIAEDNRIETTVLENIANERGSTVCSVYTVIMRHFYTYRKRMKQAVNLSIDKPRIRCVLVWFRLLIEFILK